MSKQNNKKYSFYIYKVSSDEFVKGTFDYNLDTKELQIFLGNELYHLFVILARFLDSNNNIVDNPSQHFMTMNNLKYKEKFNIDLTEIENNLTE